MHLMKNIIFILFLALVVSCQVKSQEKIIAVEEPTVEVVEFPVPETKNPPTQNNKIIYYYVALKIEKPIIVPSEKGKHKVIYQTDFYLSPVLSTDKKISSDAEFNTVAEIKGIVQGGLHEADQIFYEQAASVVLTSKGNPNALKSFITGDKMYKFSTGKEANLSRETFLNVKEDFIKKNQL